MPRALRERPRASVDPATVQAVQRLAGNTAAAAVVQRDDDGPTVTIHVAQVEETTFRLRGTTLRAVSQELAGRTEWGLGGGRARYRRGTTVAGVVNRVTIWATPKRELPEWPALGQQPQVVQREWNRMMRGLTWHEDRHVQIFRDRLEVMRTALKGLSVSKLKAEWAKQMKALEADHKDFDTVTHHGKFQREPVILSLDPEPEDDEASGPSDE